MNLAQTKKFFSRKIILIISGFLVMAAVTVSSIISITATPRHNLVMLLDDGELILVVTTDSRTVDRFLREIDMELNEGDVTNYPLDTGITDNMIIGIYRAMPITVTAMGESQQVLTTRRTPAAIAEELGFDVASGDYIIYPWAYEPIDANEEITLIKTSSEIAEEEVQINYTTINWENHALAVGESGIVRGGQCGYVRRQYYIEYHDGVEVSREIISEETLIDMIPAIVEHGTRGRALTSTLFLNTPRAHGFEYSRSFTAEATAYDPSLTAPRTPITATGQVARRGIVATDPRVIPMGTRMYITCPNGTWSYGFAVAGDTGGAIRGYKVDLFMCTRAEALQFGRRRVKVYILD